MWKMETQVAYKSFSLSPFFQLLSSFYANCHHHSNGETREKRENSRDDVLIVIKLEAEKKRCKIQIIHDRNSKLAMPLAEFGLLIADDDGKTHLFLNLVFLLLLFNSHLITHTTHNHLHI